MDNVVRIYLYSTIILCIVFFIFTSKFFFWIINGVSTALSGPTMYSYAHGGPTLSGRVVMSLLLFGLIFGIIDWIYSSLNGDDTNVAL